jgi:hypothetical protein
MRTTAHSFERAAIKIALLFASIIIHIPVAAKASSLEPFYDCGSGSQRSTAGNRSAEEERNCFDSLTVSSATPASTPLLLHAVEIETYSYSDFAGATAEAVDDVSPNNSKQPIPESSTLTLFCIGLVTVAGFHLRKTYRA